MRLHAEWLVVLGLGQGARARKSIVAAASRSRARAIDINMYINRYCIAVRSFRMHTHTRTCGKTVRRELLPLNHTVSRFYRTQSNLQHMISFAVGFGLFVQKNMILHFVCGLVRFM